jgi:hypothetical protein
MPAALRLGLRNPTVRPERQQVEPYVASACRDDDSVLGREQLHEVGLAPAAGHSPLAGTEAKTWARSSLSRNSWM